MYGAGYDIISKWEHLANEIVYLARSLGFAAYVKKCTKGCYVGKHKWFEGTYYRVSISGDTSLIPVILDRKKCNKRTQIKSVLHTGFSVQELPEDNYYGFVVDSDHLYMMGDFTVTHNCGKTAFVRYLIKQKFNEKCHLIWMDSVPSLSFIKALCVIPTLKVFVIEEITSYNKNPYDLKRLLEFLDGEKSVSNSIVIATTNYPKELEQNLADRPSRFDIPLEIKEPNEQETKVFFEYFLKRNLTKDEVTLSGLTVAHIKECCLLNKLYDLPLQQCYEKVLLTRTKFKDGFIVSKATGHYA